MVFWLKSADLARFTLYIQGLLRNLLAEDWVGLPLERMAFPITQISITPVV
jgi:hypothetical protein